MVAALIGAVLTLDALAVVVAPDSADVATADTVAVATTTTTTSTTTTTTLPPTSTEPPTTAPPPTEPPTTAPPPTEPPTAPPTTVADAVAAPAPTGAFTYAPYQGLGTWADVYDWSAAYGGSAFGLADVDRAASLGVQTLFLQTGRADNPEPVLEESTVRALIARAHAHGMRVVAWFLPYLDDPQSDLDHLLAAANLPVDGLAVDIESRSVADVAERNARLVNLSAALRAALPGEVISAIVLPPVIMEDVNPNYWPGFPWADIAPYYDIWQPMDYWSFRTGYWRSAYNYTAVDVDRVRAHIGNPTAPVHPIGGVADTTTVDDVAGMLQAAAERGCIGGSLYDYRTTGDELWPALQTFRSLGG